MTVGRTSETSLESTDRRVVIEFKRDDARNGVGQIAQRLVKCCGLGKVAWEAIKQNCSVGRSDALRDDIAQYFARDQLAGLDVGGNL